jgi:hypothetical protein
MTRAWADAIATVTALGVGSGLRDHISKLEQTRLARIATKRPNSSRLTVSAPTHFSLR